MQGSEIISRQIAPTLRPGDFSSGLRCDQRSTQAASLGLSMRPAAKSSIYFFRQLSMQPVMRISLSG